MLTGEYVSHTPAAAGHGRKAAFQRAGASHKIVPAIELDRWVLRARPKSKPAPEDRDC